MRTGKFNSEDLSFYKEILENLCAIVYTLDLKNQKYVWGNEKYFKILGYKKEEIFLNVQDFVQNYFHPDDKILLKERTEFFMKNKGNVWSGVYRIKHKEGHYIWVYSKLKVFKRDEHGNPTQLLGIVIDTAEIFKTHKQVTELFKERIRNRNHEIIENLTIRELDIIELIAAGYTYVEIAKKLLIQPDTVNKHSNNILKKLNLNNIASLISFAKETGLA